MTIREFTGGNVRILETCNQNILTDIIPRQRHRVPISDNRIKSGSVALADKQG